MEAENLAESIRKFLMRRATVDATSGPMSIHEGEYGLYVYFRDGRRFAVTVAGPEYV
jgi:predicted neutral ceramidase superfamily lipid hydrolase